jgi:hypothetical protein
MSPGEREKTALSPMEPICQITAEICMLHTNLNCRTKLTLYLVSIFFLERSFGARHKSQRKEHAYRHQIGPGGIDDCDGIRSDICRLLELCTGNRRCGRVFGARSYRFFGRDRTQPAFAIAPARHASRFVLTSCPGAAAGRSTDNAKGGTLNVLRPLPLAA